MTNPAAKAMAAEIIIIVAMGIGELPFALVVIDMVELIVAIDRVELIVAVRLPET